jgi:hypothetical protein
VDKNNTRKVSHESATFQPHAQPLKKQTINKKCQTIHMPPSHFTQIIGYFVIETSHKWVHGSVQLWKKEK